DQTCCCSSVYVQQRWVWDLPVRALVKEASMPETHPVANPRPSGAPPCEPVVRLGTPAMPGGASHPNHPVLLPDPDADDDVAPIPHPTVSAPALTTIVAPHPPWYRGLIRPTAYLASGMAGAVLVTVLYGILGSRVASPGGRSGPASGAGAMVEIGRAHV